MSELHPTPVIHFEVDSFGVALRALWSQQVFYGIRRHPIGRYAQQLQLQQVKSFKSEDWAAFDSFRAGYREPSRANVVTCSFDTVEHISYGLCRLAGTGAILPNIEPYEEWREGYYQSAQYKSAAYLALNGHLNDCITQAVRPDEGEAVFSVTAINPAQLWHLQRAA